MVLDNSFFTFRQRHDPVENPIQREDRALFQINENRSSLRADNVIGVMNLEHVKVIVSHAYRVNEDRSGHGFFEPHSMLANVKANVSHVARLCYIVTRQHFGYSSSDVGVIVGRHAIRPSDVISEIWHTTSSRKDVFIYVLNSSEQDSFDERLASHP